MTSKQGKGGRYYNPYIKRFPDELMFKLTNEEWENLNLCLPV